MSSKTVTRRVFLAAGAGAIALGAGVAAFGMKARGAAFAADESEGKRAATQVHSLCEGCSSRCGFTAYVVDGKLDKVVGDANHPNAQGTLCTCGYGYTQITSAPDRLTEPLKKNGQGTFEAIDWDTACQEIADKAHAIMSSGGPQALAAVYDGSPTATFYVTRFMNALGSANIYTHDKTRNLSEEAGFAQVIGTAKPIADVEGAKMVLLLGSSFADGACPATTARYQAAHEAGVRIVLANTRCSNSIAFADEWIPLNAGTDLALVLAMAHVLVERGLYDPAYLKDNSVGFDEWAGYLAGRTPEWAADITGIPATTIERLACELADAAPAASVDMGTYAGIYQNTGETARAVCLFNTLLGCWNQEGGVWVAEPFEADTLVGALVSPIKKPAKPAAGQSDYPLALPDILPSEFAVKAADEGIVKGMLLYHANMAAQCPDPAYVAEALGKLDLVVAIDDRLTETARLADYVLPECSYLESMSLPDFISGKTPAAALRNQVLDRIYPATKSCDEIITSLAQACAIGEYFPFTLEELADAELQSTGTSLDELKSIGTRVFTKKELSGGAPAKWNTPTGKIQFCSTACEEAGLAAYPMWVEPYVTPNAATGALRLVSDRQAHISDARAANIEYLAQITDDYELDRAWMNEDTAAALGITSGDSVTLFGESHEGSARIKTTQRIHPSAVYLPNSYGHGLRQADFAPFHLEPGYGSAMTQEALVTVKKVGA